MIRAFVFLIKVGLLAAAAIWLAGQEGSVQINWSDYKIVFPHIGYFVMALAVLLVGAIMVYRIIDGFVRLPATYQRYRRFMNQKKGFRALTRGLVAVAAGDKKAAAQQSARARKLLPQDEGLPLLLQAQAERLQGNEKEAQQSFAALTQNKDAAFLGVRGLLLAALETRNHSKALELARQALGMHPQQSWILKIVYDLEIRERHWKEALALLSRLRKAGAMSAENAIHDSTAIYLARAEGERNNGDAAKAQQSFRQAFRQSPEFAPAALALAKFYKAQNKPKRACGIIERAWKISPHPDLVRLWEELLPAAKSGKSLERYSWAKRLAALNPTHPESDILVGRAAMQESLWGEAREHFRHADQGDSSARLYWLWATMEKRAGSPGSVVQALQEKASSFPPDPCWVCRETGRIYEQWTPVAEPHGSFNSIHWAQPGGYGSSLRLLNDLPAAPGAILDAPRTYGT